MIPGLSTAGIGNPGSLAALIALAAGHGFGGVDTGAEPLAQLCAEHGVEGARAVLKGKGVAIGAIGLPVQWRQDEDTFRRDLGRLPEVAAMAAAVGCSRCTTYMLPSVPVSSHAFALLAVRRLRQVAAVLHAYGLRLALEYVSPHHLRTLHPHLFIDDQAGMLDLIAAIDRPGVGLLVDSLHWYCSGGTTAELAALAPELIVHVHINDAPPGPREAVLDNGRLFPGEGAIDLVGFVGALCQAGYRGFVSLEVLSTQPPPAPPEQMAARAAAGLLPLLQ